jgi:hypothetical protein
MARKSYSTFNLAGSMLPVLKSMATALATLASGANPDGTAYTLPVDNGVLTSTKVTSGTGNAQGIAATANMRLCGFSAREKAGSAAAASFNLYAGTDNTGTLLAVIELAADGSVQHSFPAGGLNAAAGIYVERVSGTSEIVLHTLVKA